MTDVSNFSEEFTSMPAVDSPSVVPPNVEDVFQNYSFVAPSVLFAENNVISEDLFRPNPDKKPSTSNLVGCKLKVCFLKEWWWFDGNSYETIQHPVTFLMSNGLMNNFPIWILTVTI